LRVHDVLEAKQIIDLGKYIFWYSMTKKIPNKYMLRILNYC
jgi:hypothetical protein